MVEKAFNAKWGEMMGVGEVEQPAGEGDTMGGIGLQRGVR